MMQFLVVSVLFGLVNSKTYGSNSKTITFIKGIINESTNETISENMYIASDLTFDTSIADFTFYVSKTCECRMQCLSNPRCRALAVEPTSNGLLCKIIFIGAMETEFLELTGATYIYWQNSIPGEHLGIASDKLLYNALDTYRTVLEARIICQKLPGHRLAIIKNHLAEVFEPMASTKRGTFLDVRKTTKGTVIWGDGTPFVAPPGYTLAVVYPQDITGFPGIVLFKFKFFDKPADFPERVICQANPIGVFW